MTILYTVAKFAQNGAYVDINAIRYKRLGWKLIKTLIECFNIVKPTF